MKNEIRAIIEGEGELWIFDPGSPRPETANVFPAICGQCQKSYDHIEGVHANACDDCEAEASQEMVEWLRELDRA